MEKEVTKEGAKNKTGKKKKAFVETLATISDDCNEVYASLQSLMVKSPQLITATLSL